MQSTFLPNTAGCLHLLRKDAGEYFMERWGKKKHFLC